ncbi:Type 4 prepilin-like protein leader peptide-processing enzyme [compost metagenome]
MEQTLLTLLLASVLGLLFGAGLSLIRRLNRGQPIPFGPFLSAGALISYLWGDAMLSGYEQLLSRLMLGWI